MHSFGDDICYFCDGNFSFGKNTCRFAILCRKILDYLYDTEKKV